MGIYDEIQTELSEAFDSTEELNDAVITFTVTQFGTSTYNPTTGVNTRTENTQSCRGVEILNLTGEHIDEPTISDGIKLLVLDSEKPFAFDIGMKVVTSNGEFKISAISPDPAYSTWTLSCRKWS